MYTYRSNKSIHGVHVFQAQHDKIKRKALLGGTPMNEHQQNFGGNFGHSGARQNQEDMHSIGRANMTFGSNAVDLGAVVGGMEANGVGFSLSCEMPNDSLY